MKAILEKFDFIKFNEPMSNYTAYKTGGPADMLAIPEDTASLKELLLVLKKNQVPTYVFGNCTNLIVRDKGIRGAVILTNKLNGLEVKDNIITASCGVSMAKLAAFAYEIALSGMEAVSGIPGTVGGAVYMNAGSYGTSMEDILISSEYLDQDMQIHTLTKEKHEFGCRKSFYTDSNLVILKASFKLTPADKNNIKQDMIEYAKKRKSSQPLEYPSCGSVFKRPVGYYAGKLIEDAGLKGYSVNGAEISTKHAGFIINKGNATSKDILSIIDLIKTVVYNKYKVDLEPEVRIIGEE
ncbi:MAG TPA: UDP-N-acetylmuramate dehydrogenase [Clostridia bacterium]|nr:MAG: UDP-N-acetylenolpyruvoylglucosamine reductase [Firmicutes bacterium ADurb.Bin146]HOD93857.1 UDP-N-acetylmuramate dehydrogenase [Clostridia bacterium]HOM43479.1 UDP-N-acetylmuramate dehydrogenase [Bacillota bacterium]HQM39312.1 UDP-N-acetylmuramate dehydrogenase [Clostridia bacterium]